VTLRTYRDLKRSVERRRARDRRRYREKVRRARAQRRFKRLQAEARAIEEALNRRVAKKAPDGGGNKGPAS